MSVWSWVLSWGLAWILWLQAHIPGLLVLMLAVSALGTEYFFLLVLPFIYWCVDARLGTRLGLMLCLSASLNASLKLLFHQPRPYWISSGVQAGQAEGSYGLPSGHAQNAVVFWGILAQTVKSWVRALFVFLILLVGFSRILLGVHFPSDVLVGWGVGGLLLWVSLRWEKTLTRWFASLGQAWQIGLAFACSLLLVGVPLLAGLALPAEEPISWSVLASQAFPGLSFQPRDLAGVVGLAGVFFGFLSGWSLLRCQKALRQDVPWTTKALRYLLGIVVAGGAFLVASTVTNGQSGFAALFLRYLLSAAIGLWISYGAPRLFLRLRL
jgi:membrane-associated phospholipid phosphatase